MKAMPVMILGQNGSVKAHGCGGKGGCCRPKLPGPVAEGAHGCDGKGGCKHGKDHADEKIGQAPETTKSSKVNL